MRIRGARFAHLREICDFGICEKIELVQEGEVIGNLDRITLTENCRAVQFAEEGYDPEFGARPLRRLIQRQLQDVLALKLLKGEVKEGESVRVSLNFKL